MSGWRYATASLLVAASLLQAAAAQDTPPTGVVTPPEQGVWYEIFVRSFQDSDGDGVGDLAGVTSRLDYLAELGITGIWLMPIHPSPSYHGYDVEDYYAINPEYGTLEDFQRLLDEAHQRNIRVIIDFVPNHSAVTHPWFIAAASGDPAYRDHYVWSDDPPDWRGTGGGDPVADWVQAEDDVDARLQQMEHNAFLGKLEDRLASAGEALASMKKTIARKRSAARAEWQQELEKLVGLRETFERKVEDVRARGKGAGNRLRKQTEELAEEITEEISELREKVNAIRSRSKRK